MVRFKTPCLASVEPSCPWLSQTCWYRTGTDIVYLVFASCSLSRPWPPERPKRWLGSSTQAHAKAFATRPAGLRLTTVADAWVCNAGQPRRWPLQDVPCAVLVNQSRRLSVHPDAQTCLFALVVELEKAPTLYVAGMGGPFPFWTPPQLPRAASICHGQQGQLRPARHHFARTPPKAGTLHNLGRLG